ncbi:HD domain-containing protein [Desulfovibrio sp. OttesenSCG-928-I05]|nr:HD domain-containing protein [Desulfovibrio sp. OttesenSCG-928-I05]
MRVLLDDLLFALSMALDFVEAELLGTTSNHGKRTALVSARICRALGMSDIDIFDMACCAILHDSALTAYMLEAGPGDIRRLEGFRNHCVIGEQNALAFPFAGDATGIVLHHHENWNGSGFHQLEGDAIPLRAAVLRLADNMDLVLRMGDGRAGLAEEIRAHAPRHAGTLYSPGVVDALLGILDASCVADLADENIDAALDREIPAVRVEMNTEQMLWVCEIFAFIIDAKSPFTRSHSSGIAHKARCLAPYFGLEGEERNKLVIAAYLHDVGKLSTPLAILEKPGKLTDDEYTVMRRHVAVTHAILCQVEGLEDICRWGSNHHEKLNGCGYPKGFDSSTLDMQSRILACCDIYQALTESRPYRKGMSHAQAMDIMNSMVTAGELDGRVVTTVGQVFECIPDPVAEQATL